MFNNSPTEQCPLNCRKMQLCHLNEIFQRSVSVIYYRDRSTTAMYDSPKIQLCYMGTFQRINNAFMLTVKGRRVNSQTQFETSRHILHECSSFARLRSKHAGCHSLGQLCDGWNPDSPSLQICDGGKAPHRHRGLLNHN